MIDHIKYRETPCRDDIRRLFWLGVDRFNAHGEKSQLMGHPGKGLPRYLAPYREGIRCAQRGQDYSRALSKLVEAS